LKPVRATGTPRRTKCAQDELEPHSVRLGNTLVQIPSAKDLVHCALGSKADADPLRRLFGRIRRLL